MRLAQRRRKRRLILLGIVALLVLSIVPLAAYISHLSIFTIGDISVQGAQDVRPELVRAFVSKQLHDGQLHIFDPNNELWYPRGRIEAQTLKEFPRLSSVSLHLSAWTYPALVVTVSERQPDAIWCSGALTDSSVPAQCYYMDASGVIFAPADAFAEYTIFAGGNISASSSPITQVYLPGKYAQTQALITALSKAGFDTHTFTVTSDTDFTILTATGLEIKASFDQSPDTVVNNLQAALSADSLKGKQADLQYVDLRFSGRAYYRFKSSSAQ